MKRSIGWLSHHAWVSCALCVLFLQAGCEEKASSEETTTSSADVSGLSAAGGVSTSSNYVLISTTAPVAIHTRVQKNTAHDVSENTQNVESDDVQK